MLKERVGGVSGSSLETSIVWSIWNAGKEEHELKSLTEEQPHIEYKNSWWGGNVTRNHLLKVEERREREIIGST